MNEPQECLVWEADTFGNGVIDMVFIPKTKTVMFRIKAGFMEGTYHLAPDEIKKLKWFVRQIK